MDPFTQRMLERAKIRRDKLDSQKMELEQIPTTDSSILNAKRKPCKKDFNKESTPEEKKEKTYITSQRKSKLQKLANFYSGNEANITLESDEISNQDQIIISPEKKHPCKLGRLIELTTKIKQWDDDLDNQKNFGCDLKGVKEEKQHSAVKEDEKKKNENQTSWDKSLMEKLCSQGFTVSPKQSKLIYDFENIKEIKKDSSNTEKNSNAFPKPNWKSGVSNEKIFECEPGNKYISKNKTEVCKKAAIFETSIKENSSKCVKDPAELSLAERKALFEKKGDVVFPKNCFAFSKGPVKEQENKRPQKLKYWEDNKENNVYDIINQDKTRPSEVNVQIGNEFSMEKKETFTENLNSSKPRNDFMKEKITEKCNSEDKINCSSNLVTPQPPPMPNFSQINSNFSLRKNNEENFEVQVSANGRLYPSLSNLDMTAESETTFSEGETSNESKNSNFCLNLTLSELLDMNKNNPTTPPHEQSFSKSFESQRSKNIIPSQENNLNDFCSESDVEDELLSSPPKMMKSSSFEFTRNQNNDNPLMHTVSFYRKQQQNSLLSPEVNIEEDYKSNLKENANESVLVQNKIQDLLVEINKQQTIISQASQALNLCISTVEFSGSGEQVEGERLLLLATHKRQACLNEVQRLKVENSLWPTGETNVFPEKGDVILSNINIKLKRDALRALAAAENLVYFVCLIKSDEQVFATPAIPATKENLKDFALSFPGQVKLEGLRSNFKITVEIYSIELSKELLPHDIKYHILNKKEKKLLTPLKMKKSESKLIKPSIQSPAGPNAVRTSIFQMCGYIVFSLKEVTRTQWILNKVPYVSPLEGTISMTIASQLRLDDEFRGFLTMFDDISGFGAWHRRWCLLSSHLISYWKYPDDEQKKVPNGTIDLRSVVTENVGLVSRDICARLNTFLLETTRPRLSDDKNSLVLTVKDDVTTIRHLLSADNKQEMMVWCKKINTTLALLRSWKCNISE